MSNWIVSISYVPSRRVVFGKRTKTHTYYKVLSDRAEAFALVKMLNDEIRADEDTEDLEMAANGPDIAAKLEVLIRRVAGATV